MKKCTYCDYANYDTATHCRKCDNAFVVESATVFSGRRLLIGPERAKGIRSNALSMVVLGLMIKVYWGGYGPWPTIDFPILVTMRTYLEPLLLYGGGVLYIFGWIAPYL